MMLEVNIEKIIPVTEARDSLNNIIEVVENSDELYVITKNGKPAAIIVGVNHLEKLTGVDHKEIMPDEGISQNTATSTSSMAASQDDAQADITQDATADQPSTPLETPVAAELPIQDDDIFAPTQTQAAEATQPASSGFETPEINQTNVTPVAPSTINTEDDIFGESFDDTTLAASAANSPATFNNASVPLDQVVPSSPVDGQFSIPTAQPTNDSGVEDIFGSDDVAATFPNTNQQTNAVNGTPNNSQV